MKQVRAGLYGLFRLHPSPGRQALRRQWFLGVPVLWIFAAATGGDPAGLVALAILGPLAWLLLLYDMRYLILPDGLVALLALSGLAVNATFAGHPGVPGLTEATLGACFAGLLLETVRRLYRLIRGFDGLGFGDVKLFAALGCWVGWAQVPTLLLVACLATLGGAILARLRPGQATGWRNRLPFGPGLLIALYCVVWLSRSGGTILIGGGG